MPDDLGKPSASPHPTNKSSRPSFTNTDVTQAVKYLYPLLGIKEIYLREEPTNRVKLLLVAEDSLWVAYKKFILSKGAQEERAGNVSELIIQRHGINLALKHYAQDDKSNSLTSKMNTLSFNQERDLYTNLDLLMVPENWTSHPDKIQSELPFLNDLGENYLKDLKGKATLFKNR